MRIALFFLLTLWCLPNGTAQTGVYPALNKFLDTRFFIEFQQIRTNAESTVRSFKRKQDQYSPEDVQAVVDAYNTSAEYFNNVLRNIKQDLLDPEKRRFLVKFPADYSKQVECDLYRAKDFYQSKFQTKLLEVTGNDTGTGATLALVISILNYGKTAIDILASIREELRKFNDGILEQYLIGPYQFKSWDAIN